MDNGLKATEFGAVTIVCKSTASHLILEISDTGIGMEEEETERIFERFYRADASRGEKSGFGLGLSIAAVIAQEHKGVLKAESGREGTRFLFTLPLKK